jgi:gelsolin
MDITDLDISEFKEKEETLAAQQEAIEKSNAFMATVGQEPLEIYRMEKFVPTLQDTETYGKFHTGDSYVCVKKNEKNYDLHYWHGKECTADEMGSSACWTVQLSGWLKMESNHHLEEQMYESDLFMSYFRKMGGLEYLPGGIESGFK